MYPRLTSAAPPFSFSYLSPTFLRFFWFGVPTFNRPPLDFSPPAHLSPSRFRCVNLQEARTAVNILTKAVGCERIQSKETKQPRLPRPRSCHAEVRASNTFFYTHPTIPSVHRLSQSFLRLTSLHADLTKSCFRDFFFFFSNNSVRRDFSRRLVPFPFFLLCLHSR